MTTGRGQVLGLRENYVSVPGIRALSLKSQARHVTLRTGARLSYLNGHHSLSPLALILTGHLEAVLAKAVQPAALRGLPPLSSAYQTQNKPSQSQSPGQKPRYRHAE